MILSMVRKCSKTLVLICSGLACLAIITLLAACQSEQEKAFNAAASANAFAVRQAPPMVDYQLAVGDSLSIKFLYNAELNEQMPIRPDGKIALPLIGELRAAGLTAAELRQGLTEKYAHHLKRPEVSVIVTSFDTQKAYVGGEVNRPGVIPLVDRMTVLGALTAAGGMRDTSAAETIFILRDQGTDRPLILMVDFHDQQQIARTDIPVRPRDIIYIPMSPIAKADLFVDQYINKLLPISRSFNLNYQFGSITGF
jgi:polysaccharide biosynthesis/export protein